MRKNTLFLSYDGMTDPLGQSQVLPYLTGLSKNGYSITLISFEKPGTFDARKDTVERICLEFNISWHPLRYTKRPPVLSTIKDVRKMQRLALRLHRKKHFSLVHCRSYIAAMTGLYLKKKGVPFIFDMRGFWADERVDGGLWNLNSWLYKRIYSYFKKKERQFLNEAGAIVSLTYNAKEELESWNMVRQPLPIHVIPCCVDLTLFNPDRVNHEEIQSQKERLNINETTTVLSYIGSIGTWYMLDEMLDFFKTWMLVRPDSVFVFITPEAGETIFTKSRIRKIPDENIKVISGQRKDMPLYTAMSDYSVFFIKPAYSKKASSPTKQAEIMAMGVPVICNAGIGDTDMVVKKFNAGALVESFDEKSYEQAVIKVTSQPWNKTSLRDGASDFFSLEKGVAVYTSIYSKVINGK